MKARTRKDGLASVVVWDQSKRAFDGSVIFAPGMPNLPGPVELAPHISENSMFFFQPQYFGTFDSDGRFSPASACDTIKKSFEHISQGNFFDIKSENSVDNPTVVQAITGHSFGTFSTTGAIIRGLEVEKLVLFSPMMQFGIDRFDNGFTGDLERHVRHVKNALPFTFRLHDEKEWDNFFNRDLDAHPFPAANRSIRTKVMTVVGDRDGGIDVEKNREFCRSFFEKYSSVFEFEEYVVVEGAGHDLADLLTPSVVEKVISFVQK